MDDTNATPALSTDRVRPSGLWPLHTLSGHTDEVRRIGWSPDGRMLASPSSDRTIRIWNAETGELLRILEGHRGTVYCVGWSADGLTLASGAQDDRIRLWDVQSWTMRREVVGHAGWVNTVAWSPVGATLASGSEDATVRLWQPSGEPLNTLIGHHGNINTVAWSCDGRTLASGSGDSTIRLWDAETGDLRGVLEGHGHWVYSVAWSPDGRTLASGSWDGTIRQWDAATGRQLSILEGHASRVSSISFSSDGRLLASKGADGHVRLWRSDTWEAVASLSESGSGRNSPSLAFHPTVPILATPGNRDRDVRLWQLNYDALVDAAVPSSVPHYRNAKVVLIGDTGVGKSGLATVLTERPFHPTQSTHGRNIHVMARDEVVCADQRREMREILLWDTAGQPGYRLIHQLHLNEVALALVVFDARSETDPFAGVHHWARSVRQAYRLHGNPAVRPRTYLVAARIDRGGIPASRERIEAILRELAFDRYFETSAADGHGIPELAVAIRAGIDWEMLPKVTSSELFDGIKRFLVSEQSGGRLLSTADDLFRAFCHAYPDVVDDGDLRAKFGACIGLVENHRLIRRLSFGGLILLRSELLDSYAASIINAAKSEPDGWGFVPEDDVLNLRFAMSETERVTVADQERLLLIATVEELLQHEIGFKEVTELGSVLVFPSQFTRERPDAPDVPGRSVVFTFDGPVPSIYATLAVRLSRSRVFQKQEMWRNAATFAAMVGGICGMQLQERGEGHGELTLFFDDRATDATRYQFEDYIAAHLQRRALPDTIRRRRIMACSACGEIISDSTVERRRARGHATMNCPVCDAAISLLDHTDRLARSTVSVIVEMDQAADHRRDLDTAAMVLHAKEDLGDYDVFLCHNGRDKTAVKEIGERLKEHGILPWLDEWCLIPGRPWQRVLADQIHKIKSAAVFVGKEGVGPWQEEELEAFLSQFVERSCPIIPVLLADAPAQPELPLFLKNRTWVDFHKYNPDPMKQLVWGITGERGRMSPG